MEITKTYLKNLVYQVNGAAIEVHKALGPGLLEDVYQKCLEHELTLRGINFQKQFSVPVHYKGVNLETDMRCDLLIDGILVVELKAVTSILPIHEGQLLTYMKLLGAPKGLMINFNVAHIFTEGQKTYVNGLYATLPN